MSTESDVVRVENLPVHMIKPSEFALRAVDRSSEAYLALVDSIRQNGILNAILVTDSGEGVYGLVDGLHRLTAAKDAGKNTIPAVIKNMADAALMEAQIITNLHKVETKPMDYTKQLYRLLSADPMLTRAGLAAKLNCPVSWLDARLSLSNLTPDIQDLVNDGRISLANGYALAKLPQDEQGDYVDRAVSDPPTMFVPLVSARQKQIKDAARQGREAAPASFEAVARVQSRATLLTERESFKAGPTVLKEVGANSAQEGWQAAIQWSLSLDPSSVKDQAQRYEDRKKAREDAREKAKAEREARKIQEAAEAAARIENL